MYYNKSERLRGRVCAVFVFVLCHACIVAAAAAVRSALQTNRPIEIETHQERHVKRKPNEIDIVYKYTH